MKWLVERDGKRYIFEGDSDTPPTRAQVDYVLSGFTQAPPKRSREELQQQRMQLGVEGIRAQTGADWAEHVGPGVAALAQGFAGIAETPKGMMDIARSLGIFAAPTTPISMLDDAANRLSQAVSGISDMPTQGPETIEEALSEGPRGVAEFATRAIVENAPQIALSGGIGGGLKMVAPKMSSKAAAGLAAWIATAPQEAVSAFEEVKQVTGEDAPVSALVTGTLAGLLEIFGDAKIVKRFLGGDELASVAMSRLATKIAKRSAQQGAREAGVESGQEILQLVNLFVNAGELPEDAGARILNAGAMGMFAGAGFSGITDVASARRAYGMGTRIRTEEQIKDEVERTLKKDIPKEEKDRLRKADIEEQAALLGYSIGSKEEADLSLQRAAQEEAQTVADALNAMLPISELGEGSPFADPVVSFSERIQPQEGAVFGMQFEQPPTVVDTLVEEGLAEEDVAPPPAAPPAEDPVVNESLTPPPSPTDKESLSVPPAPIAEESPTTTPPAPASVPTGKESLQVPPAPALEGEKGQGSTRQLTVQVDGESQTVNLTPEQAKEWDKVHAEYEKEREFTRRNFQNDPERIGKNLKAIGIREAADKRRITGLLTAKEKENQKREAGLIKPGRTVIITEKDGSEVTGTAVTPPAFGRVRINVGGTERMVSTKQVRVQSPTPTPTQPSPPAPAPVPTQQPQPQAPQVAEQEVDKRQIGIVTSGPKGAKARFRYRVFPASEFARMLVMEVNEQQTRARKGNTVSEEQIETIAASPDAPLLLESRTSQHGAPVARNERVIAGNGRGNGILKAYARGTAGEYEATVREFAQEIGIDTSGIEDPVLIREVIEFISGDERSFVVESNPKYSGAQESVSEQALLDAEAIGDGVLASLTFTDSGDLTADALSVVSRALAEKNRGITRNQKGEPDKSEANRRVLSAFLARMLTRAGRGVTELTAIMETDGGKRAVAIVAEASTRLAKLADDLSLAQPLVEALVEIKSGAHAVANGVYKNLAEWLQNLGAELFASRLSPVGRVILEDMVTFSRAPSGFREMIDKYLEFAEKEQKERDGLRQMGDFFGNERQIQTPETYFSKLNRIAAPASRPAGAVAESQRGDQAKETVAPAPPPPTPTAVAPVGETPAPTPAPAKQKRGPGRPRKEGSVPKESKRQRGEIITGISAKAAAVLEELQVLIDGDSEAHARILNGTPKTDAERVMVAFIGMNDLVGQVLTKRKISLTGNQQDHLVNSLQENLLEFYKRKGGTFPEKGKGAWSFESNFKNALANSRKLYEAVDPQVESETILANAVSPQEDAQRDEAHAESVAEFEEARRRFEKLEKAFDAAILQALYLDPLDYPNRFSEEDVAQANRAEIQQVVAALMEKHGDFLRERVGQRMSIPTEPGPVGDGMSVNDVEDAVIRAGVTIPEGSEVRVVHNSNVRWEARVALAGGRFVVTLNAARLTDHLHARENLYHELLHVVFADPQVRDLWGQVIDSLTEEEIRILVPIYGETAVEEAAVRKVLASQPKGIVAKFIEAVKNVFRRLFGRPLPAAQILLGRALRELDGAPLGADGVRFSFHDQTFASRKELAAALGVDGLTDNQKEGMRSIAAAQQLMVSKIGDELKKITDKKLAKQATRIVKDYVAISKLVEPEEFEALIQQHPDLGRSDIEEIAARNILNLHMGVRAMTDSVRNDLGVAVKQLHGGANPLESIKQGNLSDHLVKRMSDRVFKKMRSNAAFWKSVPPDKVRPKQSQLADAFEDAYREGVGEDNMKAQLQAALSWVTANAPETVFTTPAALREWIRLSAAPTAGRTEVMSRLAFGILTGINLASVTGIEKTLLAAKNESQKPGSMRAQANNIVDVIDPQFDIESQIAALEIEMATAPKGAAVLLAFDEFSNLWDSIKVNRAGLGALLGLQTTPEYVIQVRLAQQKLNAKKSGIMQFDLEGHKISYKTPGGETVTISYGVSGQTDLENQTKVNSLITEIAAALNNKTLDPLEEEAYKVLLKQLRDTRNYGLAEFFQTTQENKYDRTFQIPLTNWTITVPGWNPINWAYAGIAGLSKKLVPKYLAPLQGVMRKLPGRVGQQLAEEVMSVDFVIARMRQLNVDPKFGAAARTIALFRAAVKAGFVAKNKHLAMLERAEGVRSVTQRLKALAQAAGNIRHSVAVWTAMEKYNTEVVNVILAGNQNPGQPHVSSGSKLLLSDGRTYVVTEADMEFAKYIKQFNDRITQILKDDNRPAGLVFNPLLVDENGLYRQQSDYGLKVARDLSIRGAVSAKIWVDQVKDINDMARFLADGDAFFMWVTQFWQTTNPEFWVNKRFESLRESFTEIRKRFLESTEFSPVDLNSLDEFLAVWAQVELDKAIQNDPNTTVTLGEVIDRNQVRLFEALDAMAKDLAERTSGKNKLENVPDAIISAVSGQSGLTMARGVMGLHDGFYQYSAADEVAATRRQAAAVVPLQMRQILVIKAAIDALNVEIAKRDNAWKDRPNERARRKNIERNEVLENTEIMTSEYMEMIRDYLTAQVNIMESNMAKYGVIEDEAIEVLKQTERMLSGLKLTNIGAVINNLTGSLVVPVQNNLMVFGRIKDMLFLTATYPFKLVKSMAQVMLVKGLESNPAMKRFYEQNRDVTNGFIGSVIKTMNNALQFNELLMASGAKSPVTASEMARGVAVSMVLPTTSGRASEPSRKAIVRLARLFNTLMFVPSAMSQVAIQGLDNVAQNARLEFHQTIIEAFGDNLRKAIEHKIKSGELVQDANGEWRFNQIFQPSDLAYDMAAMSELRSHLRSLSVTLENLAIGWLNRISQNPDAPVFEESQMASFIFSLEKMNNLVAASNVTEWVKAKGVSGFIGQTLLRFLPYQFNQLMRNEDVFRKAMRNESEMKKGFALMIYAILVAAVAVMTQQAKAVFTYLLTGRVPATPQLSQVIAEPTFGNAARVAVAGGISIYLPLIGEIVSRGLGNTSNKPIFNPAEAVPLFSDISNIMNTAQQIVQTGNVAMPMLRLVNDLFPPSQLVTRFAAPGPLAQSNANRALRSAAPIDVETRQFGGGGGRYTPASPILDRLIQEAYKGNRKGVQAQKDRLVTMYRDQGMTRKEAERKIRTQVQAKAPDRAVFGRTITDTERARIVNRMSGTQKKAYERAKGAFRILDEETKVSITDDQKIRI
jgi:hypothetical protein